MDPSSRPLGTFRIMGESFKIPFRSCNLFFPIVVLVIVPNSLLFWANDYITNSSPDYIGVAKPHLLGNKFSKSTQLLMRSSELEDERLSLTLESIIPVVSYIVLLFSTLATLYASASSYTGDLLSVGGLFLRIRRRWAGPFYSVIYVTILSTGYLYFVNRLYATSLNIAEAEIGLMALGYFLCLIAYIFYSLLGVVWKSGLVLAVVESRNSLVALGSAEELVRGRWFQGWIINFVLLVVSLAITGAHDLIATIAPQTAAAQFAFGLVLANLGWLLEIFTLIVFTVYYYECRKARGVRASDGDVGYSPLGSSPNEVAVHT